MLDRDATLPTQLVGESVRTGFLNHQATKITKEFQDPGSELALVAQRCKQRAAQSGAKTLAISIQPQNADWNQISFVRFPD